VKIILEVKGYEDEQDRQKETAARRWVRAVNRHGEFGKWHSPFACSRAGPKRNWRRLRRRFLTACVRHGTGR